MPEGIHGTPNPDGEHILLQPIPRPPFDCIALLLQGGGALGAYQGGVYEALAEAALEPDWVAGISIGAINAAIIAGNAPERRLERLRQFWHLINTDRFWFADNGLASVFLQGDAARQQLSQMHAALAVFDGVSDFFAPRLPPPWLQPSGTLEATSFYDCKPLKATLERLVDFDRLNAGPMRLSIGAVNIRSGNFVYFDTTTHRIGPEHVMASGALPPGFPPVEIEGEFYWDGGLVSNTPLQWMIDSGPRQDTLAFQVDLWSALGEVPRNLAEVFTREKEIRYSSRTRAVTDYVKKLQAVRCALAGLLKDLPDAHKGSPEAALLAEFADNKVTNIAHLIYRAQNYEGYSKDFDFSRLAMTEHWRAGYYDTVRTLRHPEVLQRPKDIQGVRTFDVAHDGQG